jgi:hypothetical protein
MSVVTRNRVRDLYLSDGSNVIYIPQEWCDMWSYADGHTGGLDWTPEQDDMAEGPEIYCYAPSTTADNSEVETLFVLVSTLETLPEITEQQARLIHPALFAYLDAINRGQL